MRVKPFAHSGSEFVSRERSDLKAVSVRAGNAFKAFACYGRLYETGDSPHGNSTTLKKFEHPMLALIQGKQSKRAGFLMPTGNYEVAYYRLFR